MTLLEVSEEEIRRQGPGGLVPVCWRQWRAERGLRRRGVLFRSTDPELLERAYSAMSPAEFEAINGRQAWANWRTIPRALSGNVQDRPLRVVDLGCGSGLSTEVLAFWCPRGSKVIGYEISLPLVLRARAREYRDREGRPVDVAIVHQGVTEPLRDEAGDLVLDASVDLASASGVVGHHLTPRTVIPLVFELVRLLVPDGLALLDVGPTLGDRALSEIMGRAGFRRLGRYRSSWLDPTGAVAYRRM